MSPVVIDTNVLHVANNNADHAGPACVITAIDRLQQIIRNGRICIDSLGFILHEYHRQGFSRSGQPGVGDEFFKWLHNNQANQRVCELVDITPLNADGYDFKEFPKVPGLQGFDPSDRKFVAVALSSSQSASILNAVDSDWWNFREELAANRVLIEFLCPEQFGE